MTEALGALIHSLKNDDLAREVTRTTNVHVITAHDFGVRTRLCCKFCQLRGDDDWSTTQDARALARLLSTWEVRSAPKLYH